jgi:guanosine-3',5'-bis(diphosphate) 3'-pyrophosphohydrolase
MSGVVRVTKAACFAAQAHTGQMRKGGAEAPYVNHLAEVAAFVAEATEGRDADLVAAAWLHDVVEDCDIAREEIASRFGAEVADLVLEVTDDMSLPKEQRRQRQIETVATKSPRARLLKLADKTSNVTAVVESPPADWSQEELEDYLRWAVSVVDAGCRGLNAELEAKFDHAVGKVL